MNEVDAVHALTRENLVAALPPALQKDPSAVALAESMADQLAQRPAEIDRLRLYPRIDHMGEELLDILADDYKVDWWDADYTLPEKRRTLKDSWKVHKLLGTKTAVELGLRAIYPHTKVLRWWEYGGEPYHYRLDIDITNDSINSEKQRRVLQLLEFYRSLRDQNDGVTYFVEARPAIARAVLSAAGLEETAHVPLVLPVPVIKPLVKARTGIMTNLWESTVTRLDLPAPVAQSRAIARAGVATWLCELFSSAIDIPAPTARSPVTVRAAVLASLEEDFIAGIVLPDIEPPAGKVNARGGAAAGWLECYTTQAIPYMDKRLTAAVNAETAGAVAAVHETAETYIDLRR